MCAPLEPTERQTQQVAVQRHSHDEPQSGLYVNQQQRAQQPGAGVDQREQPEPDGERRQQATVVFCHAFIHRELQQKRARDHIELQHERERQHLREWAAQFTGGTDQVAQPQPCHLAHRTKVAGRHQLEGNPGEVSVNLARGEPALAHRRVVHHDPAGGKTANQHDEVRHVPVQDRGQAKRRELRRLEAQGPAREVHAFRNLDYAVQCHALKRDGIFGAAASRGQFRVRDGWPPWRGRQGRTPPPRPVGCTGCDGASDDPHWVAQGGQQPVQQRAPVDHDLG